MGNYEQLKTAVEQVIKQNGNEEITGVILQNTLKTIIATIGENKQFAGLATPTTVPGTPDANVFYLASQPGVYANFGGYNLISNKLILFSNKTGSWVPHEVFSLTVNGLVEEGNQNAVSGGEIYKTISQTDDGKFSIEDELGNKAVVIDEKGITQKMQFADGFSFDGISNSTNDNGEFSIEDELGNKAVGVTNDGELFFSKITNETIDYLNSVINGGGHKIRNKKVAILGDSISTNTGGGNANLVYPQQYWGLLEQLQGCVTYRNAIGGTTITQGGQGTPFVNDARWQSLDNNFIPDVIIVFGGINDFLQDIPLGVRTDTVTTTFYGALDYLYKNLLNTYNSTRIFHMTPLHTTFSQGGGLIPEFNGTNYLSEYIDAIYHVARRYGVSIIDTNRDSGISCFNIDLLSDDKIHIKDVGHKMIYNTLINYINLSL